MRPPTRPIVLAALLVGCGVPEARLEDCRTESARLRDEASSERGAREALEQRLGQLSVQNAVLERTVLALAGDLEAADGDRSALRDRLESAHGMLDALADEQGTLGEDLERTRRSLASAQQSLEELRAREAAARRRAETFRGLLTRMRDLIAANRVRVRITRNRMVVELPEAVLFRSGRAEIGDVGREVLEEVSGVLASLEDRDLQVAGHTDSEPIRNSPYRSNWHLSSARALNVMQRLEEHGVPAARLSFAGYADTQPVAPNDTDEGRAQNRRIEIVLQPRLDELPDLSALDAMPTGA